MLRRGFLCNFVVHENSASILETLNTPKKDYYSPSHTAEHILNQTMIRMFGTNRSVSNHIEKKKSKCDYLIDRDLSKAELESLENEVNIIISQRLDVTESFVKRDETTLDLSKLPQEAGDLVRVISVGDYDHCPCIGEHVENTSEIGTFKIISSEYNSQSQILRIRWKLSFFYSE